VEDPHDEPSRRRAMGVPRISAATPTVRLIAPADAIPPDCVGGHDSGRILVVRPECLREVSEVVHLLAGRGPVMIDLDRLDPVTGRRAFDVVSGIAYAFDGTITRIDQDRRLFLVTGSAAKE
jgi:FtsZ-interacting cell division protein YlmF